MRYLVLNIRMTGAELSCVYKRGKKKNPNSHSDIVSGELLNVCEEGFLHLISAIFSDTWNTNIYKTLLLRLLSRDATHLTYYEKS